MPEHQGFIGGEWNAQCAICGFVFKSAQLSEAWDKSMRCARCFEVRHPQDFVTGIPDNQSVPWSRSWQMPVDTEGVWADSLDNPGTWEDSRGSIGIWS